MKKLWFKSKSFGWGWTPCTWEGWAVTAGFVAAVFVLGLGLTQNPEKYGPYYAFILIALIVLLMKVCYAHGEKPKWNWGK